MKSCIQMHSTNLIIEAVRNVDPLYNHHPLHLYIFLVCSTSSGYKRINSFKQVRIVSVMNSCVRHRALFLNIVVSPKWSNDVSIVI